MSYDVQLGQDRRRAARERTLLSAEDAAAIDFLRRLDDAPFEVTEWEAYFCGGLIAEPRPLSDAQRSKIEQMRRAYESRLPAPLENLNPQISTRPLPAAERGKCGYFVRAADGGQVRCNEPATVKNMLGAEYCATHARVRAEATRKLRELRARV